jgi:hypothetical protein
VSATAIWTVHCHGCGYWSESVMSDTRRGANRAARKQGWIVGRVGEENLCPKCRPRPHATAERGEG